MGVEQRKYCSCSWEYLQSECFLFKWQLQSVKQGNPGFPLASGKKTPLQPYCGLYVLLPFWPNSPCDTKHLCSMMLKTAIKKCKPSTIIPSASITNGDETNSFSNPSESSLLLSPSSFLSPNIPWPTSGFRWRRFTLCCMRGSLGQSL